MGGLKSATLEDQAGILGCPNTPKLPRSNPPSWDHLRGRTWALLAMSGAIQPLSGGSQMAVGSEKLDTVSWHGGIDGAWLAYPTVSYRILLPKFRHPERKPARSRRGRSFSVLLCIRRVVNVQRASRRFGGWRASCPDDQSHRPPFLATVLRKAR